MYDDAEIGGWFEGRIPDGWFTGPAEVVVDRDEVLVVGPIPDVDRAGAASPAAQAAARTARATRFREETRAARMKVAAEAEHRFGRKVSWGVRVDDLTVLFTTASVPVMTRLRQPERRVLDTLVDAGVARSRSEALAWCVKLVGANQAEWIRDLQEALVHVEKVRSAGPAT